MHRKAAGSLGPVCLVVLALLVPTSGRLSAQETPGTTPNPASDSSQAASMVQPAQAPASAAPTPTAFRSGSPVAPKVIGIKGHLELDEVIRLDVDHLNEWALANDPSKLVPYLNGRAIRGNYPVEIEATRNRISYHLQILPENRRIWTDLLGAPDGMRSLVTLSVGLEDQSSFDTIYDRTNPLPLTVISLWYGVIAAVLTLVVMALLIWLARTTNLIRETGPTPPGGKLRPYNLGRTQMAFWFFLVYVSYLAIWLITNNLDTITVSLLALIGISASTALSEALIDSGKDTANTAKLQDLTAEKLALEQNLPTLQTQIGDLNSRTELAADSLTNRDSLNRQVQEGRARLAAVNLQIQELTPSAASGATRGFLRDILSDASGYCFHRFQIFAWTILLGIMFVSSVYNDLSMPEFSTTLLGLMGISSGTYIGFKFPEQK